MATYRAYRIDTERHIQSAAWVEAPDDDTAKEKAAELCDDETPVIEVWKDARLVDEIDCEPD